MKNKIRRKNRAINAASAMEILRKGEYGVLSTSDNSNQPYGVPLSYALIDDEIFFHSATEGHKLENIAANSKVSFCVVGPTEVLPAKFSTKYECAIVYGTATIINGDEKHAALFALIEKYSPDFLESGREYIKRYFNQTTLIKLSIDHLTGKARK